MQITLMKQAYRHKKTGGVYRCLHYVSIEKTGEVHVAYRLWNGTGKIWARPPAEFCDGRFEPVERHVLPFNSVGGGMVYWVNADGTHYDV